MSVMLRDRCKGASSHCSLRTVTCLDPLPGGKIADQVEIHSAITPSPLVILPPLVYAVGGWSCQQRRFIQLFTLDWATKTKKRKSSGGEKTAGTTLLHNNPDMHLRRDLSCGSESYFISLQTIGCCTQTCHPPLMVLFFSMSLIGQKRKGTRSS